MDASTASHRRQRAALRHVAIIGGLLLALLAPLRAAQPVAVAATAPRTLAEAAQTPAYASLAAAATASRYLFRDLHDTAQADGSTFDTSNAAQGYHARWAPAGLTLESLGEQRWTAQLATVAVGYGDARRSLGAAAWRGDARELRRSPLLADGQPSDLTEWYRNDAAGLEHGWTIAARPSPAAGALELALALTGDLRAVPTLHSAAVALTAADGVAALQYGGLRSWDAAGRALPSHFIATADRITVVVDDAGAVYPVTVDPRFTAQQTLTQSGGSAYSNFGAVVAVSGDTAIVGAPLDDIGTNQNQGSATVFVRTGTTWSAQQFLTYRTDIPSAGFGRAVAVDGDTILVGSNMHSVTIGRGTQLLRAMQPGDVTIYVRSGSTWTEQQIVTNSDGDAYDRFGTSVALDGDTALIGAEFDHFAAGRNQGSATVFIRTGTTWVEQQLLTRRDGANDDYFGTVALSGDTALIGAPGDDIGLFGDQGSATVFVRTGATWTEQQVLFERSGTFHPVWGNGGPGWQHCTPRFILR